VDRFTPTGNLIIGGGHHVTARPVRQGVDNVSAASLKTEASYRISGNAITGRAPP